MNTIPPEEIYTNLENCIAIIGMAGRFPGAKNVAELWENIQAGKESISFFSDEEMLASGIQPALLAHPSYVKARGALEQVDTFDAAFFGFMPREAEITDPQHRLFLECCWEALEDAGYDPLTYEGPIGLYAGSGGSSYLILNLLTVPELMASANSFQIMMGNDKDFLTTRASYKLNLKGPSMVVQTACSTSLVAVHLACQSLLQGECDMALAGGVSISLPNKGGYLYQEGGVNSSDGHCYAFDARGQGFVSGNGAGIVVLKRLDQALADHDHIYAVIRGTAVNNDGALKAGYTAPGLDGQTRLIAEALAIADVSPETITYIETHGTGTPLGDPIEIAALTEAFQSDARYTGYCAIGSIKTNIGHLGAAAGVSSLIKTALALMHQQIPPSLHFEQPNPNIPFSSTPFYVNTTLKEWQRGATPRRAGVNSLGIGGTNAHVILEEAPVRPNKEEVTLPWQLLPLSARTSTALEAVTDQLVAFGEQHPEASLADIAYTLQMGRHPFPARRFLVCKEKDEAYRALQERDPERVMTHTASSPERVIFLFPGQGVQHLSMAHELYVHFPFFRELLDECAELLLPLIGCDLRQVLFPRPEEAAAMAAQLATTALTQPALFVIEYTLARQLMQLGLQPEALLGHSLGEYVAACLAGVFSLPDALAIIAVRGRLMDSLPHGRMLSVSLPAEEVQSLLGESLSLAAINGPSLCVVSGPTASIAQLEASLIKRGINCRMLHIAHAAHSAMVEPMQASFLAQLRTCQFQAPTIPFLSNVTGTWITDAQATDPSYWVTHLRQTVRFADCIQELLKVSGQIWLEVGPGKTLATCVRQYQDQTQIILPTLRAPQQEHGDDLLLLLQTLGKYWLVGGKLSWEQLHVAAPRQRLSLPTYPFERRRYWIDPAQRQQLAVSTFEGLRETIPDTELESPAAQSSQSPRSTYVAAGNEIEQTVLIVWHEVLGIEHIGIHDDFFELGGSSVIATQLMARLREIFPVELRLSTLFDAPTIASLAEAIEEKLIESLEALPEELAERLIEHTSL